LGKVVSMEKVLFFDSPTGKLIIVEKRTIGKYTLWWKIKHAGNWVAYGKTPQEAIKNAHKKSPVDIEFLNETEPVEKWENHWATSFLTNQIVHLDNPPDVFKGIDVVAGEWEVGVDETVFVHDRTHFISLSTEDNFSVLLVRAKKNPKVWGFLLVGRKRSQFSEGWGNPLVRVLAAGATLDSMFSNLKFSTPFWAPESTNPVSVLVAEAYDDSLPAEAAEKALLGLGGDPKVVPQAWRP